MSEPYRNLPNRATLQPVPFTVDIPQLALDELKLLLKYSKIPADTYESVQSDFKFGLTTEWIRNAKAKWENEFDWRKHEARINSSPQYTVDIIDDDKKENKIHFAALYSDNPDAIPIIMLHGWPGSFLEFLPILDILRTRFNPKTLPYHVIVPSLPGYGFSFRPPLDRNFVQEDVCRLFNKLMVGLGFGAGYVAQGGDIGSRLARILASEYSNCKAVHCERSLLIALPGRPTSLLVNYCPAMAPPDFDYSTLESDVEKAGMVRLEEFRKSGTAYAYMHAHRSSTIGIILASNPIALLAWIGEKFVSWTDHTPTLDGILESVSLYWFTESFPTTLYPYRQESVDDLCNVTKPVGYSYFPKEIEPVPRSWVAKKANIVFFRQHSEGGHFAALEQPETLLADIEAFIAQIGLM